MISRFWFRLYNTHTHTHSSFRPPLIRDPVQQSTHNLCWSVWFHDMSNIALEIWCIFENYVDLICHCHHIMVVVFNCVDRIIYVTDNAIVSAVIFCYGCQARIKQSIQMNVEDTHYSHKLFRLITQFLASVLFLCPQKKIEIFYWNNKGIYIYILIGLLWKCALLSCLIPLKRKNRFEAKKWRVGTCTNDSLSLRTNSERGCWC